MFFNKVTALALLGCISAGVVISPSKPDGCVQIHPDCNPNKCVTIKVVKPDWRKPEGHKDYDHEKEKDYGHKKEKDDGHKKDKDYGHKEGKKEDAQKWRRWNTPPPRPTYEVVIEECCGSPEQDWIVKDSFIQSAAPDLCDLCITGTADHKGIFLNGGKIGVEKCDASDCGQAWCYDPKYKTFILKDKNVAIDLPNGKAFDGACLQQWQAYPGNPNQVWKLS